MWSAPPVRAARVAISRESLWQVASLESPSEQARLADRRGRLVLSAYAVYTDTRDTREFDGVVVPVMRTMAASSARCMLALTETRASFDAGRVRGALQVARDVGLLSVVEISGSWAPTLLELLAAAAPTYIRLSPDLIRGAAAVPELSRSLVTLGEFARERAIPLIARNPLDDAELEAVRAAGIGLMQWVSIPIDPVEDRVRPQPTLAERR
jgi:hypothetical protein